MATPTEKRAFTIMACVTMVWSGLFPTGKIALQSIPPFTFSATRLVIGSLLLYGYMRFISTDVDTRVNWNPRLVGSFLILGFCGYLISVSGSYFGLRLTTATNAALLNTASPVIIAILAALFLKERLSKQTVVGISLSVLGVGVIIARGSWQVLLASEYNTGDLIIVGSLFGWGTYTTYGRHIMRTIPPLVTTTYAYIAGAFFVVLASVYTEWGLWQPADTPLPAWGALAYQSILGTLSHLGFYHAVSVLGPSRAGIFINLVPVMAIGLAYVLLNEVLTLAHLVGGLIVLGGVAVTTRGR
jgi:drug/metabolite transporter (DMT)-like permease